MKRKTLLAGIVTLAVAAGIPVGPAVRAEAQMGFFGPVIRPLGPRYPTSLTGYPTPFFVVNPNGMQGGYLGPNGPHTGPGSQYSMPLPSQAGGLYTPLSPNGTFGDPSTVETYNATGTNQSNPAMTAIPRTSDTIEARIDSDNRLVIKWTGEPRAVSRIRVALLDKDRKVLKEENVTKLPAQAKLAITSKTSYYQVYVEYVNGTVTNVISPL